MKLTRNFRRREFTISQTALRRGIDNTIPNDLVPNLQRLADWLQLFRDRLSARYQCEMAINISSGYRCPNLNRRVKGSHRSMHMQCLAADFTVGTLPVDMTFELVIELMGDTAYDQCIEEFGGWIHIGLAEDGDYPRVENLIARKRRNAFGRLKTVYERV